MTPEEVKTVIDYMIEHKKAGQFRVIWSSFEQAVNLITSNEVDVIDCWEPMVFVARTRATTSSTQRRRKVICSGRWPPTWSTILNAARRTWRTPRPLDFMLGPWYGAKITLLRGYMTNPMAPEYAKAHPEEFSAEEAAASPRSRGVHAIRAGRHCRSLADPRRRLRGGVAALQVSLTRPVRPAGVEFDCRACSRRGGCRPRARCSWSPGSSWGLSSSR